MVCRFELEYAAQCWHLVYSAATQLGVCLVQDGGRISRAPAANGVDAASTLYYVYAEISVLQNNYKRASLVIHVPRGQNLYLLTEIVTYFLNTSHDLIPDPQPFPPPQSPF